MAATGAIPQVLLSVTTPSIGSLLTSPVFIAEESTVLAGLLTEPLDAVTANWTVSSPSNSSLSNGLLALKDVQLLSPPSQVLPPVNRPLSSP